MRFEQIEREHTCEHSYEHTSANRSWDDCRIHCDPRVCCVCKCADCVCVCLCVCMCCARHSRRLCTGPEWNSGGGLNWSHTTNNGQNDPESDPDNVQHYARDSHVHAVRIFLYTVRLQTANKHKHTHARVRTQTNMCIVHATHIKWVEYVISMLLIYTATSCSFAALSRSFVIVFSAALARAECPNAHVRSCYVLHIYNSKTSIWKCTPARQPANQP